MECIFLPVICNRERSTHASSQSGVRGVSTAVTTPARAHTRDRARHQVPVRHPRSPVSIRAHARHAPPAHPSGTPSLPHFLSKGPAKATAQRGAGGGGGGGGGGGPSHQSDLPPKRADATPTRSCALSPPLSGPPAQQAAASAMARVCWPGAVRATRVKHAPGPAHQPHAHTTPLTGSGTPARSTTGRAGAGLPKPNIPCASE